jgi:hypothetical protein
MGASVRAGLGRSDVESVSRLLDQVELYGHQGDHHRPQDNHFTPTKIGASSMASQPSQLPMYHRSCEILNRRPWQPDIEVGLPIRMSQSECYGHCWISRKCNVEENLASPNNFRI